MEPNNNPQAISAEERENILERLDRIEGSLENLLEIYTNLQGFLKVMNWVGVMSSWLAKLAAAVALIYAGWRHFPSPK